MRTSIRAAMVFAFAIASLVGPVSAATIKAVDVAQASQQGTISGHVLDQRGAPLSGAEITVTGGGNRATATTDDGGAYSVSLPPGIYTVTVNRGGFRTEQNDGVVVTGGEKLTADVTLTEINLQTLQIIGRTSATTTNRAAFNISEAASSALPSFEISARQNNNLTDTIATLPGVFAQRTFSATPNTSFIVRGGQFQTRVTIDGHPISSGIAGQWNTNYANAAIFQSAEVVKGVGLNGSIAGESAFGTVNLRTRDFSPENSSGLQIGGDNYQGGFYNVFADINFLNDKASLIVQKTYNGFNGPWHNQFLDRAGVISAITPATGVVPTITGVDQWQGDFSNNYSLEAELVKARYRFSESSSLTLEFLGMQGQYQPQGGAYGTYDGNMTLQACSNLNGAGTAYVGFVPTLAGCNSQSRYTAPYTFGNIGNTVPAYTWFPNSYIQNNEPQFNAEFRTSWKDDTLLLRPYTHLINRFISGVHENQYPGNGGAWYAVTSAANCQVKTLLPGTAGAPATGAAGPCFGSGMTPTSPAYVGADPTGFVGATTATAPVCSAVAPFTCFTTPTSQQDNGIFGYSTPFSQPELDRLNGYTFSWIHPSGNNIYNLSIDYRKDYSQSFSGDQTAAAPGCSYVIGSVTGAKVNDSTGTPFQPGCSAASLTGPYAQYDILPRSSINTPPTVSQYTDFALTGSWALGDKLHFTLGNYFELYKLNAQIEDPAVLAAYAARGNSAAAPVSLIGATQTYSHYDPHVGFQYRYSPTLSLRATAGSSITQPYPALVSGFGSIVIPNAAAHNYTNTVPNFNLKPETTMAYDAGFDFRLGDGSVFSLDAYHSTTHNVFISNNTTIAPVTGITTFSDTQFLQINTVNGPLQRQMGIEASWTNNPRVGFGWYESATLQRSFYDQLPSSLYLANTTPFTGNFNITGVQIFGYPFFKSYSQVFYNGKVGEQYELGMDWEGQDNSTLGPAYLIFDGSLKYPIWHNKVFAQLSFQNMFYTNTGTGLGRNLASQGFLEPTAYLTPATGAITLSSAPTSVQALPPPTIRLSLTYGL